MAARDHLVAHRLNAYTSARALGWFSLALGISQLLLARPLAKALDRRGDENLIRAFAVGELVLGAGCLGAAQALDREVHSSARTYRDYRDRSGFPRGLEAARAATRDFIVPPDLATPAALRPWR